MVLTNRNDQLINVIGIIPIALISMTSVLSGLIINNAR